MSILGLDIGTTGAKAVAFRDDGALITSAYREYHLKSPQPGFLELDPHEVLAAVRHVAGAVAAETRGDPIRSVATSTLGEAAVPVDAAWRPVGNAIVGFDARGEQEMAAFKARISNDEVFAITGHGINSYHTLFKILWRRDYDRAVFDSARKFLCFGDFVTAQLGAPPRMDWSMASRTLAFDIHRLAWSRRILDAAGLSPELFPEPVGPGERVGEVTLAGASELGLPRGCVVAGGLHDQPAGILGAGIRPGESMLATGTVICLGVRLKGKPVGSAMAANNLCYYPTAGEMEGAALSAPGRAKEEGTTERAPPGAASLEGAAPSVPGRANEEGTTERAPPGRAPPGRAPPGRAPPGAGGRQYVSIAWNFTGGSLLKWYRDTLAGPELAEAARRGVDPYDVITEGLPDGPTGLLVLPHFTTTGTPWLDPRALGAILGLRLTTTRQEIVKAILEGIVYEVRLNADLLRASGIDIGLYKAIGGAAKSAAWMQIAADILDRPVAITRVTEGAALGAALLGARAAGIVKSLADVEAIIQRSARVERVIEPRPEHARRYAERFAVYRDLYPATRELSHRIFQLP